MAYAYDGKAHPQVTTPKWEGGYVQGTPVGTPAPAAYQPSIPYGYQQNAYQQPAAIVTPSAVVVRPTRSDSSHDCLSVVVFLLGFLFCPIWCAGWAFVKSRSPAARGFGVASSVCSMLGLVGFLMMFVLWNLPVNPDDVCYDYSWADNCMDTQSCGWCITTYDDDTLITGGCMTKDNCQGTWAVTDTQLCAAAGAANVCEDYYRCQLCSGVNTTSSCIPTDNVCPTNPVNSTK
eukprot:NODE_3965_length_831_cov_347.291193_g3942_i0.p1 GENE.NODE_3965_length_831_cov_347.291193_g3942_i0~~NODE_3965_length_831_cov_347.291193_g3942_i0.p1  ORF type:complete len:233 (-),score=34.20 NODE_3965_length_831_cov_347.291193_g3942_i0:48-746(-)